MIKQSQQFHYHVYRRVKTIIMCLKTTIKIDKYSIEHKRWRKVSKCYGSAWESYGKVVEFRNM